MDPGTGYASGPGDEQAIAHRPGREDVCTVVTVAESMLPDGWAPCAPVPVAARVDFAHRVLVARTRAGADEFELTERVVRLAGAVTWRAAPKSSPAHRRLAEAAREALLEDPARATIGELAATLAVSRSHLSRVFHEETGQTLTRFRAGVRVRAALDRLTEGEADLAGLAADLGFADHAHLTRTLRDHLGLPPSKARELLSTNVQAVAAETGHARGDNRGGRDDRTTVAGTGGKQRES